MGTAPRPPGLRYCRHVPANESVTKLAVSLAGQDGDAVQQLVSRADHPSLERARADLVARLYQRPDDYEATAALRLVNRALAALGWDNPYSWKHRRKP